jgi:gluconolactonase
VRAYDVDRNGDTASERVIISGIVSAPGGMTVDENGNLVVTAKGVTIYSPAGKRIQGFQTKEFASSCVFGEADLKSLMVTARGNVYRARFDDKEAK